MNSSHCTTKSKSLAGFGFSSHSDVCVKKMVIQSSTFAYNLNKHKRTEADL